MNKAKKMQYVSAQILIFLLIANYWELNPAYLKENTESVYYSHGQEWKIIYSKGQSRDNISLFFSA